MRRFVNLFMMMVTAIILFASSEATAGPVSDKVKEVAEAGKEKSLEYLDKGTEWATGVSPRFVGHLTEFFTEGTCFRIDQYSGEGKTLLALMFFSLTLVRLRNMDQKPSEDEQSLMIGLTSLALSWFLTALFEAFNTWPAYHEQVSTISYFAWLLVPLTLIVRWRAFKALRLALKGQAFRYWLKTLTHPFQTGEQAPPAPPASPPPQVIAVPPKPARKFCGGCGNPLGPNAKFCGRCGKRFG